MHSFSHRNVLLLAFYQKRSENLRENMLKGTKSIKLAFLFSVVDSYLFDGKKGNKNVKRLRQLRKL